MNGAANKQLLSRCGTFPATNLRLSSVRHRRILEYGVWDIAPRLRPSPWSLFPAARAFPWSSQCHVNRNSFQDAGNWDSHPCAAGVADPCACSGSRPISPVVISAFSIVAYANSSRNSQTSTNGTRARINAIVMSTNSFHLTILFRPHISAPEMEHDHWRTGSGANDFPCF
jgi:hypothetical protein